MELNIKQGVTNNTYLTFILSKDSVVSSALITLYQQ